MPGANVFVELKANITEFQAKMGEARSEISKLEKHQGTTLEKVSAFGKGAMLGVAGAAVGVGGMAIEMADKQEIKQKQLEASLKSAGTEWGKVKDQVKQAGDESTKYGFNQAQVDSALNLGVISTQNLGKAHDNLKVAIDLSKTKNIDLDTAMQAVDKAANGQTAGLKKLGIDLNISAGGAKKVASAQDALSKAQQRVNEDQAAGADYAAAGSKANNKLGDDVLKLENAHKKLTSAQQAGNNVLDALKQRLSGQADAAADTFAGKLAAAKAQATNLGAEIGDKLMPVLSHLMGAVEKVVHWLEKHKGIAIALGIVIGTVLVAAIGTYIATQVIALAATVATGVGAMATGVMMAAAWLLALGPIGLLIVAVTAIVGVFIVLYKHSQLVREIVATIGHAFKAAFDFILGIVKGAIGFIKTHWELLLAILTGPIGLILLFIKDHFDQIKQIVMGAIDAVVGFFTALPGRVTGALGDVVGTIFGAFKNAGTWVWQHVLQPVIGFFTSLPSKIVTALGDFIGNVFAGLTKVATWLENHVFKPLHKFFAELPGKAFKAVGDIVGTVFAGFMTIATWFVTNVELPVIKWFTDLPGKAFKAVGDIVGKVFKAFMTIATWFVTNVEIPAIQWFTDLPGKAFTAIGDIVGTVFAGLTNIATWLETNVWTPVVNFFTGLPGRIAGAAGNIVGSVLGGIPGIGGLFKAEGGPVDGGRPYIVGERGPELFVPPGAGTIIPNHAISGRALSGGGAAAGPVYLQIDGKTFATLMLPSLQTTVLQAQRTSSVNIFGSAA